MILIKAKFESIKKMKIKLNMVFSTKEEIPSHELHQLLSGEGHLIFNVDEYRQKVLSIIKNKRIGINDLGQTPSERFRKVLYLIFTDGGGAHDDFPAYYESEMEKIINHYKHKYL
jgi:hypothetical protein